MEVSWVPVKARSASDGSLVPVGTRAGIIGVETRLPAAADLRLALPILIGSQFLEGFQRSIQMLALVGG